MMWEEYKKESVKYRIECDVYEYVAILLLGIAEEYHEFRKELDHGGTPEKQVEEFGDMLWNIAELNNITER